MSKAARTRQYIIERTAPIFNRKGIAGTSVSDMTEATGLTKGAIYGNFSNKDEIALAAFEHNLDQTIKTIWTLMQTQSNPLGKIRAFVEFYRKAFNSEVFKLGCPIVNTAAEADDTHPALKEKVAEAIETWKKRIEKLVKEGMKAGEIRKEANPSRFASVMITSIEGSILIAKATGDPRFLNHSLDMLEELIATELEA